jgi:hypothetical protein
MHRIASGCARHGDNLRDVEIGRGTFAKIATEAMPISAAARATRMAISPRLAIRSFLIMVFLNSVAPIRREKTGQPQGRRFRPGAVREMTIIYLATVTVSRMIGMIFRGCAWAE